MTNFEKLQLLGEALHGARWQNAVARDLGIDSHQVYRWVSGKYEPSDKRIAQLIDVAKERKALLDEAIYYSVYANR